MLTYHNQGEGWFANRESLWSRLRKWVVWVGGWEQANGGWRIVVKGGGGRHVASPAPVSLVGHRFTWYGWGWQVRVGADWLVWCYPTSDRARRVYLSPDGTPSGAWKWYAGAPREVTMAAEARERSARGGDRG